MKVKIVILLVTTPLFVWILLHPGTVINEIRKAPEYTKTHIVNFGGDYSEKINETRAAGGSRFFYNKSLILVDEFFTFSSYPSPRIYFQAGDGTELSPKNTEPVAGIMFIFFLIGIINLVKRKQYKTFVLLLIAALIAYVVGQPKFPFILPVAMIYAFIAYRAFLSIAREKRWALVLMVMLNVFLLVRMFVV